MKQKGILLVIVVLINIGHVGAQSFSIMSYNCENAFDTIHDEGRQDEEFLPEGQRRWNGWRMWEKLRNIGKVIAAAGKTRPVDVVGLQEVENDSVMTILTKRTPLSNLGYEYIMTNSADQRGIDVALLYSPFTFHPIHHHAIRPATTTPTRDVLYVCGTTGGSSPDTLDIYLVHLPSKLNGTVSAQNRQIVIDAIQNSTDSLRQCRQQPKIVMLGDFNDGSDSKMIRETLKDFENLTPTYSSKQKGSYKYQGTWETIDQILVSKELHTSRKGLRMSHASLLDFPFLLEDDVQYGGKKPRRTYIGFNYNRGFSDHLPVILYLKR